MVTRRVERKRTLYNYVAVVEFGRAGAERKRTLQRLAILPDSRHPSLIFLGAEAGEKQAVFLLDSTASQEGEGSCRPSVRSCSLLYLSTSEDGDEHYFTTEGGDQYSIKLLGIKRVVAKARRSSKPRAGSARKRGGATGAAFQTVLFGDGSAR